MFYKRGEVVNLNTLRYFILVKKVLKRLTAISFAFTRTNNNNKMLLVKKEKSKISPFLAYMLKLKLSVVSCFV